MKERNRERIVERIIDKVKGRKGEFVKEVIMRNRCEDGGNSSSLFTVIHYLFNFPLSLLRNTVYLNSHPCVLKPEQQIEDSDRPRFR